jgi:phosphotransferase system enzyme I (PtsI)
LVCSAPSICLWGRAKPPSEDEQYEAYRSVLARMAPRRIIIRLADIGSDKPAAGWESPVEPNPALVCAASHRCRECRKGFVGRYYLLVL